MPVRTTFNNIEWIELLHNIVKPDPVNIAFIIVFGCKILRI